MINEVEVVWPREYAKHVTKLKTTKKKKLRAGRQARLLNIVKSFHSLRRKNAELHNLGARVSLFMDADSTQWGKARELGADRVEIYTQPYAEAFARNDLDTVFEKYAVAAKTAQSAGLGVNAGHDLNLQNLGKFCEIPGILEVSIGHALVADALEMGISDAVRAYLRVLTVST